MSRAEEHLMRVTGRWMVGLLVGAAVTAGGQRAAADSLEWFGVHGAYYSEFHKGAIGINARRDVGDSWAVGTLVDYVFRPNRTTAVLNIDLRYTVRLVPRQLRGWVGAGGGVLLDDVAGPPKAEWKPLAVVFAGVEWADKPLQPFVEMRFMTHDAFRGVFYAGVRF
jgi:hypothetical protein